MITSLHLDDAHVHRPHFAPDWRLLLQGRIRSIESAYNDTHSRLLNWGRWGRDEHDGEPGVTSSGIYRLKGEYDPNLDADAAPEPVMLPINNKDAVVVDEAISNATFPIDYRKVLKANYVRQLPEWQRYREAGTSAEDYIDLLTGALNRLRVRI